MSEIIATTGTGQILTGQPVMDSMRVMAIVTSDGEVSIDWERISQVAVSKNDPQNMAMARAFLAIRDGTYKLIERAGA